MDKKIREAERSGDPEEAGLAHCRFGEHEYLNWRTLAERYSKPTLNVQQRVCLWCFRLDFRRITSEDLLKEREAPAWPKEWRQSNAFQEKLRTLENERIAHELLHGKRQSSSRRSNSPGPTGVYEQYE